MNALLRILALVGVLLAAPLGDATDQRANVRAAHTESNASIELPLDGADAHVHGTEAKDERQEEEEESHIGSAAPLRFAEFDSREEWTRAASDLEVRWVARRVSARRGRAPPLA